MVVADLYQSAGTLPVNVRELGVDFATGGSVKWLCGGPGAGYLYVRRDLWNQLTPAATGWTAHEAAVRLRRRRHPLRRQRLPLPERHAQHTGDVLGALGL